MAAAGLYDTQVDDLLLYDRGYPTVWFKPLYHKRWGVEEGYKREKSRVEIENFSGRKAP
jgi:hypothetical protein